MKRKTRRYKAMKHRKSISTMGVIITLIILFLSFFIITKIWMTFFVKAEGVAAENLCRNFNALRFWTKEFVEDKSKGVFSRGTGRACKVIDRTIPSSGYPQTTEGVKQEIMYMTARCWWMWLEGLQPDMFKDKNPVGKDKCFICYTFKIKKGKSIKELKGIDLAREMALTTYKARDTSDLCAANGGGHCIHENQVDEDRRTCSPSDDKYKEFTQMVISDKCKDKDTRCCIKKAYECENKGGRCTSDEDCPTDYYDYASWGCRRGRCCVQKDNMYSYVDYIQGYKGEGLFMMSDDLNFKPKEETYAVVFTSPGGECGATCGLVIGAGAVGGVALLVFPPTSVLTLTSAAAVGGGAYTVAVNYLMNIKDINMVSLARLNDVSSSCNIEIGTGGT